MQPDPTYKTIFAHPFMVEELMRWLVADLHGARALVDALDLSRMERVHEQSVGTGALHRRANDMVWRVPFRERGGDDAGARWPYLVVMLEFQSEVDFLMASRMRHYVDRFHLERGRGRRFRAGDRLAPVLPIVLYTGVSRWTAARRVVELVMPGASGAGGDEAGLATGAGALLAGEGYLLLDTLRVGVEDLRDDNAAALLAGLENPSPRRIARQLAALCRRLGAPERAALREVMLRWAQHVAKRRIGLDLEVGDMADIDMMHDSEEVEAYFAAPCPGVAGRVPRRGPGGRYRAGHRARPGTGPCRGAGPAVPAGGAQVRHRRRRAAGGGAGAGRRHPPPGGSGGLDHRLRDGRGPDGPLRQRRRVRALSVVPRAGIRNPRHRVVAVTSLSLR